MTLVEIPEVVGPEPTLSELAEAISHEHRLVIEAGTAMIEHAIRAGEALLAARNMLPRGEWQPWLASNFEASMTTAREYMRFAMHKDQIRDAQVGSWLGVRRLLVGQDPTTTLVNAVEREEARRLHAQGISQREIARRLGKSKGAVQYWINPKAAEKDRQRQRQRRNLRSRAERRALQRQQRQAAAKRAGGSIAEAYAQIRKATQALESAHSVEADREAKSHIEKAMRRLSSTDDEIARAVDLTLELKRHLSTALDRAYAAEDEVVRASRLSKPSSS